jgi:two-component system OmpR family sensor kinase
MAVDLPEDVVYAMSRVESESVRMTGMVEDLLLLARLDEGREIVFDDVDLTGLVLDAVNDAHAASPDHPIEVDLPDEPVVVVGDAARLHQVVVNLVTNARTHTPDGTRITVGISPGEDGVDLFVHDTGQGIDPEFLPKMFERFARADSSRSRTAGSTGLGLAIVDAVVQAHGGTVSVTSVPGDTVFTVHLPAADAPGVDSDAAVSEPGELEGVEYPDPYRGDAELAYPPVEPVAPHPAQADVVRTDAVQVDHGADARS